MPGEVIFVPNAQFLILTKGRNGDVGKYLREVGERIRLLAIKRIGRKTGHLATSQHVTWGVDGVSQFVLIGSEDRIGLLHHNGTRPHMIFPRHAQQLRFSSRGKIVYARKVRHPGTKPNRYLVDSMRKVIK